jgi:hypothetical protein
MEEMEMSESSFVGSGVLRAWFELFFDGAKERWPQLTRKQFDEVMDRIWEGKDGLSIQEMNDLLEPELKKLFV